MDVPIGQGSVSEPVLRLAIFAGVLLLLVAWELAAPFRGAVDRGRRWTANVGLSVLAAALVRLVLPAGLVGVATLLHSRRIGLLPALGVPDGLAIPLTVLLFDLAIYLQHVVFHRVPILWRLHRVHHADVSVDATTGIRFHPFEILLSLLFKLALVAALGPPPEAVLLFEILLNATSMFSHANVVLPGRLDRWVRYLLVTPGMHRVHHSVEPEETNSNYGFNLSLWDRLFGTYRPAPRAGDAAVQLGLDAFRERGEQRLDRLLTQPFRSPGLTRPRSE